MFKRVNSFLKLDIWLKVIVILCGMGAIVNGVLLWKDMVSGGVLLRLHLGFFILYVGQFVFILWQERMVFILSLLQAVLALWSNADFTFSPILRILGRFYSMSHVMSVPEISVYKYVFISLAFTLELFKTYLLFVLLPSGAKKVQ